MIVTPEELARAMELIRPRSPERTKLVRIGADLDGGYVVPDLPYDACASIGIGDEASFDRALLDRGTPVWMFDGTIDRPPFLHPRFVRRNWGLWTGADTLSLADIRRSLPDAARLPMLKHDAEGIEWTAFLDAPDCAFAGFACIVGEWHGCDRIVDDVFRHAAEKVWTRLWRTHECVHLHANNVGTDSEIHGIRVPGLLELTWMRRDLDLFAPYCGPIPDPELDRPSDPRFPEIVLRRAS